VRCCVVRFIFFTEGSVELPFESVSRTSKKRDQVVFSPLLKIVPCPLLLGFLHILPLCISTWPVFLRCHCTLSFLLRK
jgi:hypothetical protein